MSPYLFLCLLASCYSQVIITKFDDEHVSLNNNEVNNENNDKPDVFLKVIITKFDDEHVSLNNNEVNNENNDKPDVFLTTPEIIRRHGYNSESHVVQTSDGYLLTVHRIPVNKKGKFGNQPIFVQHGLLSSSADFVITGDNKSLAFILSDLGYDVWLGNARGSTYSRAHTQLRTNSEQYWNFTFHEMGIYDLPAVLTYISDVTGQHGQIIYIGHSMGTTMFYAMASILPEFTARTVKVRVGLAPVAYMTYITSPIRYFAPFVNHLQWVAKHLGIKEFLPHDIIMDLLRYNCERCLIEKLICEQVIFVVCGFDEYQFDKELLPLVLSHAPAGTSTKTIIHYAQEIHHNGDFLQFDYGEAGNIVQYGNSTPPAYNLSNINVPTYFMYAENDWLSNEIDVYKLARAVGKNIGTYKVPFKYFNHVDFIWGKDAPELVYQKLINVIKKYN